jgi:putative nucleotidyltransferase with HDIG domain
MISSVRPASAPGFPFSIRWKVAISLAAVLMVVLTVATAALIRFEWSFLLLESQKRARSLAANLAINAREPLLAGDDLRLGPIVESILAAEDVRYAFLADHTGLVVYHSDPDRIGSRFEEGPSSEPGDLLFEQVPIEAEGVRTGWAVVGMGKDHIYAAMGSTVLGLIMPLGGVTFLGFLAVILVASLHVGRLEELESAMQALGAGNLLINVDEKSRDELGRMGRHFNEMVSQLNRARRRSFENYMETISALAAAVEAKDSYTGGHCDRVAMMSAEVGLKLGMNEATMKDLKLAAVLHDIGKIGVDDEIIGKGGPLDDTQVVNIRNHAVIGAAILERLSSLARVSLYVKHHHERYDGRGYPSGLRGDAIPLPSRIIHMVDAYDAMTTDRPYRKALSPDEAVARLKEGSGSQFDPELVKVFVKLHEKGAVEGICEGQESSINFLVG